VKPNGKEYSKLVCVLWLVSFIVSGCSAGRGDWRYQLTGGYAINRINAHGIALVHYGEDEDIGSYVITNFYVTDFCMNQEYIGVRGIPTVDMWATDSEIQGERRVLYLVDVASRDIYGPYSNLERFKEQCDIVSSGDMGAWQSTTELVGN
jgi:hypothetical protein